MAKAIGRTASGIWWLVGLVLAMIFGRAKGQLCTPKYGVRPYPQPVRPLTQSQKETAEKNRARAETLVNEYLIPAGSAADLDVKPEVKALVEKLIDDLGRKDPSLRRAASKKIVEIGQAALPSLRGAEADKRTEVAQAAKRLIDTIEAALSAEVKSLIAKFGAGSYKVREAATDRIVEIGPPALPVLRKLLEHEDPEVAHRAQLAIEGIEKSVRTSTLAALRKIALATRLVLEKRMPELAKELAEATKAHSQAADKDQNRQTNSALEAAQARANMAQTLYFQVALSGGTIIGLPQPEYGVRIPIHPLYGVMQGFR
jgi:HEAT repeat protein